MSGADTTMPFKLALIVTRVLIGTGVVVMDVRAELCPAVIVTLVLASLTTGEDDESATIIFCGAMPDSVAVTLTPVSPPVGSDLSSMSETRLGVAAGVGVAVGLGVGVGVGVAVGLGVGVGVGVGVAVGRGVGVGVGVGVAVGRGVGVGVGVGVAVGRGVGVGVGVGRGVGVGVGRGVGVGVGVANR